MKAPELRLLLSVQQVQYATGKKKYLAILFFKHEFYEQIIIFSYSFSDQKVDGYAHVANLRKW